MAARQPINRSRPRSPKPSRPAYQPGQRLASERDLAEEFGVSRPTIREAMLALEIRGLVEARRNSGLYAVERARTEAAAKRSEYARRRVI